MIGSLGITLTMARKQSVVKSQPTGALEQVPSILHFEKISDWLWYIPIGIYRRRRQFATAATAPRIFGIF